MPNLQYIKHDVLQIYIFKSYVRFQIKEMAKRSLCYDGPGFAACTAISQLAETWAVGQFFLFNLSEWIFPRVIRWTGQMEGSLLLTCWFMHDHPVMGPIVWSQH